MKYQIFEAEENNFNAGSKATQDVSHIADELGYQRIFLPVIDADSVFSKVKRQITYSQRWKQIVNEIPDESILLMQHPFHYRQKGRKKAFQELKIRKHVRFICFVHDVEELRKYRYNEYYRQEFEDMLFAADVLIVHNDRMKSFFLQKGVPENKLVVLKIFDYLTDSHFVPAEKAYAVNVTIAGNLDVKKSAYIGALDELKDLEITLFGSNPSPELVAASNINYRGSVKPEELPGLLNRGFGLIWDGNSLDSCTGGSGEYLQYNNPHKLSLYLTAGLPVVIWDQAAEASFVKEQGVGIAISSLREASDAIRNIREEEYQEMAENARSISAKMRSGFYAKTAIQTAENCL